MKNPTAWMPFYVGDYLGDTQRLTTEQHGAYLLLMLDYWRAGPPPDDDEVLRQIVKLDRATWKRHRPALASKFQVADGAWRHKRIDLELEAATANAERRSSKAQAAAQARWRQEPSTAPGNAPSIPQAMLGECPPPSPSPEPNGSISDTNVSSPALKPEHVVEVWNELATKVGLPQVKRLSPERRRKLSARIRGHPIEDWLDALAAIERNPWMHGDNDRGWRADFDFLLQPSSFQKLIEGSYDRKQ